MSSRGLKKADDDYDNEGFSNEEGRIACVIDGCQLVPTGKDSLQQL